MRICDWSSDVCSSYLNIAVAHASFQKAAIPIYPVPGLFFRIDAFAQYSGRIKTHGDCGSDGTDGIAMRDDEGSVGERLIENRQLRSEEHTSELQSLMRISYAVLCLKTKKHKEKLQKT